MTTALRARLSRSWTGMAGPPGTLALASQEPVVCKHRCLATLTVPSEGREQGPERLHDILRTPTGPGAGSMKTSPVPPRCLNVGVAQLTSCLPQSQDSQRIC